MLLSSFLAGRSIHSKNMAKRLSALASRRIQCRKSPSHAAPSPERPSILPFPIKTSRQAPGARAGGYVEAVRRGCLHVWHAGSLRRVPTQRLPCCHRMPGSGFAPRQYIDK